MSAQKTCITRINVHGGNRLAILCARNFSAHVMLSPKVLCRVKRRGNRADIRVPPFISQNDREGSICMHTNHCLLFTQINLLSPMFAKRETNLLRMSLCSEALISRDGFEPQTSNPLPYKTIYSLNKPCTMSKNCFPTTPLVHASRVLCAHLCNDFGESSRHVLVLLGGLDSSKDTADADVDSVAVAGVSDLRNGTLDVAFGEDFRVLHDSGKFGRCLDIRNGDLSGEVQLKLL